MLTACPGPLTSQISAFHLRKKKDSHLLLYVKDLIDERIMKEMVLQKVPAEMQEAAGTSQRCSSKLTQIYH